MVTENPKVLVACKDLFLAHITCLSRVGYESMPHPFHFGIQDEGTAFKWDVTILVLEQKEKMMEAYRLFYS